LRHRQLVQDIDAGPSSAPHSIYTKTADYSLVPDLNEALDMSTLSNVSNSNDVTEKLLGTDDMKELDVLQNVEDNFIEEISNKIALETSNGFSQEEYGNFYQRRLRVDVESENLISSGLCQEMEPEHNYHSKEATSTNNNGNGTGNRLNEEWEDFVGASADDYDATTSHILEDCETNLIELESSEAQAVCPAQGNTLNSKDSPQLELDAGFSRAGDKTSDVEDDIAGKNDVSQYSQVCRIDLLEEIIEDAKSNKVLVVLDFIFGC